MVRRAAAGLIDIGTFLYRAAPAFWERYNAECKRPVADPPFVPAPHQWPDTGIHAAWIGHSTVLMKIDGFTIVTDPVFSVYAGLNLKVTTLGVKRLVAPALAIKALPHIDLILLSHAHMDHWDIPSLRSLESRETAVITARNTSDLLRSQNYSSVTELGWGESHRIGPVTIKALEVNHWGARMRTDTHRGYNGYSIHAGKHRVLFAGDTAHTDRFRGTGPFDLGIMPIGAYNPWIRFHCNPEQAWQMLNDARVDRILPVHHSTFVLSEEPLHEPIERLRRLAGDRIVLDRIGQTYNNGAG